MTDTLSLFDLTGRTAVVTGATRGLGRTFALALADAGANIVIVGRDADAGRRVADEVGTRGRGHLVVLGDVSVRADVERMLSDALAKFGGVDILVNNAGVGQMKSALETTDDDWRTVMRVNLDGVWLGCQVFGGHMVERGSGVIVNVGSMSGQIVNRPNWQPAYNASKAAVHHLTRSLAAEWAPYGVRVNALAPGYMRTDMSPVDEPRFQRHWKDDAPMRRVGEPQELAGAIVYLASDASTFTTGEVLVVDGGYTVF